MDIDGKNYGTSSVTKGLARHRHAQAQKPQAGGGGSEMADQAEGHSMHDHGGEEGGHEAIQQVHGEHGPADKVEVAHDGQHHTVTTTHGGHVHESKGHPSVEHVHAHIGHAIGDSDESAHAEPDGDESDSLEKMGVNDVREG